MGHDCSNISRAQAVTIACLSIIIIASCIGVTVFVWVQGDVGQQNKEPLHVNTSLNPPIFRLPRTVRPLHYDIEMTPNIYSPDPSSFVLEGKVDIRILSAQRTSVVILHAVDLNISSNTVRVTSLNDSSAEVGVKSWSLNPLKETLELILERPLVPDFQYKVEMSYQTPLTDKFRAVYFSMYMEGNSTKYFVSTIFLPTYARRAFPCFDEPALKATFTLTIHRKANYVALSNMPKQLSKISLRNDNAGEWHKDIFDTSPPMSTYLLTFTLCQFQFLEVNTSRGYTFRGWSRPDSVNETRFALQVGANILPFYDDYFGIKFPLPELEMVALPDFYYGGMEHWGLVSYKESSMLYLDSMPSIKVRQTVAVVVSHELAHMWFGDLLTMAWWNDAWLNEGFATLVEYMGVHYLYPQWKMMDQFVVLCFHDAMHIDSFELSRPLYKEVIYTDDILAAYDTIIYYKGACILRMVKFVLGDATFQKSIQKYLSNFQYGTATNTDLWNTVNNEAKAQGSMVNVSDVMLSWTVLNTYPVVTVVRSRQGELILSQNRFVLSLDREHDLDSHSWDIPFTFTTSDTHFPGSDVTHQDVIWLSRHKKKVVITNHTIPSPNDTDKWVLGNVGCHGYYRVNYDEANWLALIRQLKRDHTSFGDLKRILEGRKVGWKIHAINRGQIIMDSWNLVKARMLGITIALQTLEYLQNETDFIPWKVALMELENLQHVISVGDAIYGEFSTFMKYTTRNVFSRLDLHANLKEDLNQRTPTLVARVACVFGLQSCVSMAKTQFELWMKNPSHNTLDVDLRLTIYCTAISHGTSREWNFTFAQYMQEKEPNERPRLLSALACSRDSATLRSLMEKIFDPASTRKEDGIDTIIRVSKNQYGHMIAWTFVTENIAKLKDSFGATAFALKEIFSGITASFHTVAQLQELERFSDENPDLTSQLSDALEKTRTNIHWVETNLGLLEKWLKEQNKAHGSL